MDFALNYTANLLYSNHTDDGGNFNPEESAKHLAGDENFHQFTNMLYGCAPGDYDDEPLCFPCNSAPEESSTSKVEDENAINRKRFPKCIDCQKDCRSPNQIMIKKMQMIIETINDR